MRRLVLIAAAFLGLAAIPASAQVGTPQGSYRQSCSDIRVSAGRGAGVTLSARCRDMAGGWVASSLRFRQCRDDISNQNGILTCTGAPAATVTARGADYDRQAYDSRYGQGYARPGYDLPLGDWAQTCSGGRLDGYLFRAQCLNNAGRRVAAQADWRRCESYAYANQNGRLICDLYVPGQSGYGALPGGDWTRPCINGQLDGDGLWASCTNNAGRRVAAEANVRACASNSFSNVNGRLVCDYAAPGYGALPGGDWSRTCINGRLEGDRLWASCANNAGRRVAAEANVRACASNSFSNVNGRLVCDYGYQGSEADDFPGGDWRRTCQNIALAQDGVTILARCRDDRGVLRETRISRYACPSNRLANRNGALVCVR